MVTLPSGLRLRIAESGERDAPPVLLVHGWGASLYMWRGWFAPLAAAGRRVIAIDLPGHGLSDKPDGPGLYGVDAMVDVIRTLLDLEELVDVDVVAQSMASRIALEVAMRGEKRIRRLVLVNPVGFGHVRMHRLGRLVSPRPVDRILPHLAARWIIALTHRMVYGDPSLLTRRDEDEYWAPSQFPAFARAMRRLVHEFDWERPPASEMAARLVALQTPVLVILGGRDRLVRGANEYTSRLRDAGATFDVEVVERGGHAVNEECAVHTCGLAIDFLGRRG